ncbi:right-handed parallel beta-helix repeat-containing protein [Streptomyces sp. NPDC047000]|uniref:right-handed parallel beta-helix repeat-containing protein n=1 Tax=Streptomyces sp. NPDC047000 TaxID=3155474 RepID=UPI0033F5DC87
MKRCRLTYLACTAALLAVGVGAAPPVSGSAFRPVHVVHPGESIQDAVDAAAPGDVVLVTAGTYVESVTVRTPRLTLRGMGPLTVIKPALKIASSPKPGASDAPTGSCGATGNGICVLGTKDAALDGVTVESLTVSGFARAGVYASATDRLTVRRVTAAGNGVWGIAQEGSTRSELRENTAQDNGDAGIFLANSVAQEQGALDARGTVVRHNRLTGNRIGVTVRRLRALTVARNYATGNCAGMFVVGDENTPRTGDVTVSENRVVRNNKSCPKTARLDAIQGSGIVLTGVEGTRVSGNRVAENIGSSSLSGGIVLFKSFVGAPNDNNRITGNLLDANSPADLVDTDTDTGTDRGNVYENNLCRTSLPAGRC